MSDEDFTHEETQLAELMILRAALAEFEQCECMQARAESTRRQYVTSVQRQLAGKPPTHGTDESAKAAWDAHQNFCVRGVAPPEKAQAPRRPEEKDHARERRACISPEEHAYLAELLGGRCEICDWERRVLHVDHWHGSETFRGLLCERCNPGLGMFKDKPSLLLKAAAYLLARGNIPAEGLDDVIEGIAAALESRGL